MSGNAQESTVGLLLSGGLDSSIMLGYLLEEGYRVRPFYVDSRLFWQKEELAAANEFIDAMDCRQLDKLVVLELPLEDVYQNHWSVTGRQVPDAETADEAVYLPGRNALLIIKAALWCQMHDIDRLALAVLEANPFADTAAAFFEDFDSAMSRATGKRLTTWRPFERLAKREVMELGRQLPLHLTFSCIAPQSGLHCGRCNKCAERIAAFRLIDMPDPTRYFHAASEKSSTTCVTTIRNHQ